MADRMTPEQRHRCMSRIKGKDTKPEMLVRRWLWHQGFRYRLHVRRLPGTPDIVLRRYHTVINVNGCFWHGHENCRLATKPKTHSQFWQDKVRRNRERDEQNRLKLSNMGWYVITLWECDLAKAKRLATLQQLSLTLSRILLTLNAPDKQPQEIQPVAKPYDFPDFNQPLAAEPAPES